MLPALLLIPLVALFRIVFAWHPAGTFSSTGLPGACPLSAVALCAGWFLPRRVVLVVPLGVLLLSDAVIDWHYGANFFGAFMAVRYALLAVIVAAGLGLRGVRGGTQLPATLLATGVGSTGFYVVTNTLAWVGTSSGYPQNLAGWWQSLTMGLPGYVPAYVFYRNGLVSDLLYSMVFVACVRWSVRPHGAANPDTVLADARQQG